MQLFTGVAPMAVSAFFAFFAISNPLDSVAIYLDVTRGLRPAEARHVAWRAALVAFLVLGLFAALGKEIFLLFGLDVHGFRIAGGLIVFWIGFQMVQGPRAESERDAPPDSEALRRVALDQAISPLAVPMIAGPGAIATAMGFAGDGKLTSIVITVLAFGAVCLLNVATFLFGARVMRFLGRAGLSAITRLMGLILSAIGAEMVIAGARGVMG